MARGFKVSFKANSRDVSAGSNNDSCAFCEIDTIWNPFLQPIHRLAFDSNFIEIRKIETGELVRCILGEKIRLLQTNTQEILYAYEDSRGYDTVASLDFWG